MIWISQKSNDEEREKLNENNRFIHHSWECALLGRKSEITTESELFQIHHYQTGMIARSTENWMKTTEFDTLQYLRATSWKDCTIPEGLSGIQSLHYSHGMYQEGHWSSPYSHHSREFALMEMKSRIKTIRGYSHFILSNMDQQKNLMLKNLMIDENLKGSSGFRHCSQKRDITRKIIHIPIPLSGIKNFHCINEMNLGTSYYR